MADPSAHSARQEAERLDEVVGGDVDRAESYLLGLDCGCRRGCCEGHPAPTVLVGDDETSHGAWGDRERPAGRLLMVCVSCNEPISDDPAEDDQVSDEDGNPYHEGCYQP